MNVIFRYYVVFMLMLMLYLYEYFPLSSTGTYYSGPPANDDPKNITRDWRPTAQYRALVFIVIDALREDFLTAENMPYVYEATRENNCFYRVHVGAPTVTLPRIKSLTAGIMPQFADIISNVVTGGAPIQNSFLHSAQRAGKTMVFYGDDTWLGLYPNMFRRSEGTTSLYVADYYEVDRNVSRNVHVELGRKDWDFMFLHYLGLDHIGHVEGPFSALIPGKLREMDDIIRTIKTSVPEDTLVLITGDHGMKDSGGHGGTSYSETNVPLMLLGTRCMKDYHGPIQQIDIPTSLALLFNLAIPFDGLGKIVQEFNANLDPQTLFYYYHSNIQQLVVSHEMVADNTYLKYLAEVENTYDNVDNTLLSLQKDLVNNISKQLSEKYYQPNALFLFAIVIALIYLFLRSVGSTLVVQNSHVGMIDYLFTIQLIVTLLFLNRLCFTFLLTILLAMIAMKAYAGRRRVIKSIFSHFLILVITLSHGICVLISSSYVEEEHQIWYFFLNSALVLVIHRNGTCQILGIGAIICFRFAKALNQTGDQFASTPDITNWLYLPENLLILYLFVALSFLSMIILIDIYTKEQINKYRIVYYITAAGIYTIKLVFTPSVVFAQLLWVMVAVNILIAFLRTSFHHSLMSAWILINLMTCRAQNVCLFTMCHLLSMYFAKTLTNKTHLIFGHVLIGNALYFCQGMSNSFSSIDIASGYIGVGSYQPFIVGLLILCNTYCFPVLSMLMIAGQQDVLTDLIFTTLLLHRMLITTLVTIITLIHCEHLFVWSVFAPKLLIESSHCIILFLTFIMYRIYNYKNKYKSYK